MKIVTWDSGFRFDDPNLYWGNPSYLLEPGDPGYVDPNPLASATNKKINVCYIFDITLNGSRSSLSG